MQQKTTTIRIREGTKKRLDVIAKVMGRNLIDIVDDCISAYQISLMVDNKYLKQALEAKEK